LVQLTGAWRYQLRDGEGRTSGALGEILAGAPVRVKIEFAVLLVITVAAILAAVSSALSGYQ
jgi:hypothetical protein